MYFLLPSLFFSSLLLALTHAVLQYCTSPQSHLLGLLFFLLGLHIFTPLGLHFFSPSSLAEWPLYLFIHLFLLFSISHSSHLVTINARHLPWLCFNQFLFFSSPLAEWPLPFASFFSFFLPTCLTSLTSHLHLCGLTFVHNYRGKDEPNFFSFGQASLACSICFADFLPIFQQAHLMS